MDCGDLSDIPFGSVSLTGTTFGSVATYTCQLGYSVVGSLTRLCGANGEWSGQEPVCEGGSGCILKPVIALVMARNILGSPCLNEVQFALTIQ